MTTSEMNPGVNFFFDKETKWKEAYGKLRTFLLSFGLKEELKWGCPCYTVISTDGKKTSNVVLIHGFKDYCALLFFKGALMKDPSGILIQQTEQVQSARQIRFINTREVAGAKSILKSYVKDAIALEKAGKKVELKKTSEFKVPEEFHEQLNEYPELKTAFKALTPGRQRGYLLYFSSAKQSSTRTARIERYRQQILKGKGLDD